jgi:hypothetical protein
MLPLKSGPDFERFDLVTLLYFGAKRDLSLVS